MSEIFQFILKQLERVPRTFPCAKSGQENYLNIKKIVLDGSNKNVKEANIKFCNQYFVPFLPL